MDIQFGQDVVRSRGGWVCGLHVEEVDNVVYVETGCGAEQVED